MTTEVAVTQSRAPVALRVISQGAMRLRHSFGNGDQSSKKYGRRIVPGVGPVENEDKCSEDPREIFRDDVMRLSLITIKIFEHLNLLRRRQHSWTRTGAASRSNRIRRVSKTAMVADASASLAAHFPVPPARLRRQRICRAKGRHGNVDRGRDRAQEPRSGRLRR